MGPLVLGKSTETELDVWPRGNPLGTFWSGSLLSVSLFRRSNLQSFVRDSQSCLSLSPDINPALAQRDPQAPSSHFPPMACLSRIIYALFLISLTLSPVLARPLTQVADSQLETSTASAGQISARASHFLLASNTCDRVLGLIQVY